MNTNGGLLLPCAGGCVTQYSMSTPVGSATLFTSIPSALAAEHSRRPLCRDALGFGRRPRESTHSRVARRATICGGGTRKARATLSKHNSRERVGIASRRRCISSRARRVFRGQKIYRSQPAINPINPCTSTNVSLSHHLPTGVRFFEIFEDGHAQPRTPRFQYRRAAFVL